MELAPPLAMVASYPAKYTAKYVAQYVAQYKAKITRKYVVRAGDRASHDLALISMYSPQMKSAFKGNKSALPSKPCVACGKPMVWRKSWARNWGEVKYCSVRCRGRKPPGAK